VRRVKFGQRVRWAGETWRIGAEVVAPEPTVFVSHAGDLPGRQIPPAEWAMAEWDVRFDGWIVRVSPEAA
jgi:hypothetical protein